MVWWHTLFFHFIPPRTRIIRDASRFIPHEKIYALQYSFHTIMSVIHTLVWFYTILTFMLVSYHNCKVSYRGYYFIPYILGVIPPYAIIPLLQFHTDWEVFHTIQWYNFIPKRLDFIPNEVRFTLEMNLFIPKLNKSYHTNGQSRPRNTNGTHTHRQTGNPFRSLRKSLHLSRQISLSWRTQHWCACILQLSRPFASPLHAARWWSPSAQTYSSRNQYDMCG